MVISFFVLAVNAYWKLEQSILSLPKKFTDGTHEECIGEIETYLSERINKELMGEYIFQVWELCRDCLLEYFYAIKHDFMILFYLNLE